MFNMINVIINITNNNCIYNSNLNTNKYNKIKNVNHEENKWKETHKSNQQQRKILINTNLLSIPFDFSVILPHLSFTGSAATRKIRRASKKQTQVNRPDGVSSATDRLFWQQHLTTPN